MEKVIKRAALEYMQHNECNFYAADNNVKLQIFGNEVDVETVWRSVDEDKIYLHCGCSEFEGDIDIASLSDENMWTMLKAFMRNGGKYTHKQMENAILLSADLYQKVYASEIDGGSLEVAQTFIEEACEMEKWIAKKYGEEDDDYLDHLEEYEVMLEEKYELNETKTEC